MRVVRLLIAFLALLVMVSPYVAAAREVVARIDGVDVTKSDIDWRIRNDDVLRFQPIDSPEARLEALRQLAVEIAVEHLVRGSLKAGNEVTMVVDQERRKRLLGIYEQSSTMAVSLAPGEVDRFIAATPQFFGKRKTWHYHEVLVSTEDPNLVAAMRSKAAAIGSLGAITTAGMADVFDWARARNYSIMMLNRWNGSEEIDPALMKVLEQMLASQRRVHVECQAKTCSFVVLHEIVDDPVDARFGRLSVEETLLARKRAHVASALHGGILKQAVIEFGDPGVAKAASRAWALPAYLKADSLSKANWIMQVSLLLLALVWGGWYLPKSRNVPLEGSIRRKGLGQLDERLENWRYLRITQRALAAAAIAAVCGEVVWALAYTSFLEFDHDIAAVAGGSFLALIVFGALWRFAPLTRSLAGQLRFAVTGLLAGCGINALVTWLLG